MTGLGRSGFSLAVGGGQVELHLASHRKYALIGYICTTLFQKVRARGPLATGVMGEGIIVMYIPRSKSLWNLQSLISMALGKARWDMGNLRSSASASVDYSAGASTGHVQRRGLEEWQYLRKLFWKIRRCDTFSSHKIGLLIRLPAR